MVMLFADLALPTFLGTVLYFQVYLFLLCNVRSNKTTTSKRQALVKTFWFRNVPNGLIVRVGVLLEFFTLAYLWVFQSQTELIWFNHLLLSNRALNLVMIFSGIMLLVLWILLTRTEALTNLPFEYLITLTLLNTFLPLLFLTTSIFTFFFVLEVCSCLLLFKFVTGRDWELTMSLKKTRFFNYSMVARTVSYTNIIFFQYWVSFFSSVLFVYSLLMCMYFYGTTEWVYVNWLGLKDFTASSANPTIVLTFLVLLVGMLLKLGIAPVHLYKIELYKGLPFISILFYTIYFFLVFFIFFCLLVLDYTSFLTSLWYNFGSLFLLIGACWVAVLLFDVFSLKAFFAYSTIVNSMTFLALVFSLS